MIALARPAALAVVVLFAVGAAGCKSKNEGVIVGKWRVDGTEFGIAKLGVGTQASVVYEFTADKRFEVVATIRSGGVTETKTLTTGKYRLGEGYTVYLSDLTPPIDGKTSSTERIIITNNNTMSISADRPKPLLLFRVTEK
ncbi:lipocalin family protein [bacterium]|nr:lipocalin family protein [bacterium]